MPLVLFSALVLSRKSLMTTNARKVRAIRFFAIESALSLLVRRFTLSLLFQSNKVFFHFPQAAVIINLFVVGVFAKGFFGKEEVKEIGLTSAGEYLGQAYGHTLAVIWGLGLLAAGQSSTMTGMFMLSAYN